MLDQIVVLVNAMLDAVRAAVVSEATFLAIAAMAVLSVAGMLLCAIYKSLVWVSSWCPWFRIPRRLLPEELR